jgi:hypothetical protein
MVYMIGSKYVYYQSYIYANDLYIIYIVMFSHITNN